MVETLEYLILQAADHPKRSRAALYKELLRSDTFILNLGKPIDAERVTRVTRSTESFAIWADKDPEMGGIWVPVFAARDTVADYVAAKGLKAPLGQEFLWMEHGPGEVFSLLRGVDCFAGLTLYLNDHCSVSLPWSAVKALSDGRLPKDEPEIYELPFEKLSIPSGVRLAFGKVAAGKLLCLPQAGHFKADDARKLVKLELGEQGTALIACRHFLQVLKYIKNTQHGDATKYFEDILHSLVGFEMYGEAEALCEWLTHHGSEAFAWVYLAGIYGKTGKLEDCAQLCRRGAAKYPEEKAFYVNETRALFGLGRIEQARQALTAALAKFPDDPVLLKLSLDIPDAVAH